jgi:hypothetical protein
VSEKIAEYANNLSDEDLQNLFSSDANSISEKLAEDIIVNTHWHWTTIGSVELAEDTNSKSLPAAGILVVLVYLLVK